MNLSTCALNSTRGENKGVVGVRCFVDNKVGEIFRIGSDRGKLCCGWSSCGRCVGGVKADQEIRCISGVGFSGPIGLEGKSRFRCRGCNKSLDFGECDLKGFQVWSLELYFVREPL